MYTIVYTRKAASDIPKLKAAKLDRKAKALIEVIKNNPYQTPPPYEKLVGDLFMGPIPDVLTSSTGLYTRFWKKLIL